MKYVKCYDLPDLKTEDLIHDVLEKRILTLFRGQGRCITDIEIKNDLIYIWYDQTKSSTIGVITKSCGNCNRTQYYIDEDWCLVCLWLLENV